MNDDNAGLAIRVSPSEALAYAIGAALFELINTGRLTEELAATIEQRANELHMALLNGQVLTRQPNGTYKIGSRNEFIASAATNNDKTLTIGDDDND